MRAIIVSIGDELVLGQTVDTNSAWLSARLARAGIGTLYHQTVADDQAAIAQAIADASQRAQLVIVSGGLGPTDDDLTRQAMAQAMGVELVLHEPSVAVIRGYFSVRGRPMPERNKVQALHPRGSEVIANTCGTAPGIKAKLGIATFYITPGVPSEMFAMFEKSIEPELHQFVGERQVILSTSVHSFGMGESSIAEALGDLMDRQRNPKVGTTVSDGLVSMRIRSEFATADQAQQQLEATVEMVQQRLGAVVFGRDDQTLQDSLVQLLIDGQVTLATAESCTGGLVGRLITDVAGASAVYRGGWVTYADEAKTQQLGVPAELIREHGAVSDVVVRAMARGALKQSGARLAVAITGVAGPGGGTVDKPVGTVWVGVAGGNGEDEAWRFHLPGSRAMVRDRAAKAALQLLRFRLLNVPVEQWTWIVRN
jgi:nicotinamide-nucleotide amidase